MEPTSTAEQEHGQGGEHHGHEHGEGQQGHVLARVVTSAGTFPRTGENRVKATTLISFVLDDAASDLRLTDTSGWVARVGGRQINPERTFAEENLHGTVKISWGLPESGGG